MSLTPGEPNDRCPRWAAAMIARIRELETQLGNIRPTATTSPVAQDWQVSGLADIYRRLSEDDAQLPAGLVDALFAKISRGLNEAGFAADEIAAFINSRIPSGRLPYCNGSEVEEALRGD